MIDTSNSFLKMCYTESHHEQKQIANDKLGTNICDTYPEEGLRLITCEMIDIFLTSRRKLHVTSWIDRKAMHISGPLMHAAML